jgi:drug/metabolite transporter (DMT)-like permease
MAVEIGGGGGLILERLSDYMFIAATIGFTVYAQLILKFRIGAFGPLPPGGVQKIGFLLNAMLDPFILSGIFAGFLASLAWMAAMTKFELSHAYPFMSLNFVVVLILSAWLLGEPLTLSKILGVGLIVAGTVVVAKG